MKEADIITLAHGHGGRAMNDLIKNIFLPAFGHKELAKMGDAALLEIPQASLAVSTDSFVVNPLFFPGGDIGKLAVAGTVNDLAVSGATPLYLTAGFIMEEGCLLTTVAKIARSMAREALEAGIAIVAGDTKVVERGKGDGVFINTTGVGSLEFGPVVGYEKIQPGDSILINGDMGLHGMAVLSRRHGIELESGITSDCASLNGLIRQVLAGCREEVKFMRDPTRGGAAAALTEIAAASGLDILLDERLLPIPAEVKGYCDFLGLDPLYLANEGKVLLVIDPAAREKALRTLRSHPLGTDSCEIGQVKEKSLPKGEGRVLLKTLYGGTREIADDGGLQLPRIC